MSLQVGAKVEDQVRSAQQNNITDVNFAFPVLNQLFMLYHSLFLI